MADETSSAQRFEAFAELCESLTATSSRLQRARLVAEYLGALPAGDAERAVRLLLGRAFPEGVGRRLTLGGRAVWAAVQAAGGGEREGDADWAGVADFGDVVARALASPPPDAEPILLAEVFAALDAIAAEEPGAGVRTRRIERLAALFRRARPVEAKYLAKIVVGEMRHGVQEGIVIDAIAALSGVDRDIVHRAQQALGDLGYVAALGRTDPARLSAVQVQLFQPIKPMLAQSAATVREAWNAHGGELVLEWKLDGARVQIHKEGDEVRIFSRRLQEITDSLPDVADAVRRYAAAGTAIFEGEVLAMAGERPLPFQELMRRFRRTRDVEAASRDVPVQLFMFDLLRDGDALLLDRPLTERWHALQAARGALDCVPQLQPATPAAGEAFFHEAVSAGHEGVMAKAVGSHYTPGLRGAAWLKVKHSVTLDLVIHAADWGYGRRRNWLSNYHLAARDPAGGGLVPVGKTFKGPTDAEFAALTERLLALKTSEAHGTVSVRPELVVEVRFDGVQRSPRYAPGLALRFARIVRVRDDKPADEADTVDEVRRFLR
ncbi:MAG: ATP-dependent DNA ligase [Candidatus Binatia bacterium]